MNTQRKKQAAPCNCDAYELPHKRDAEHCDRSAELADSIEDVFGKEDERQTVGRD